MSDADHISGLWTSPADTDPPVGALLTADNVAFYRDGLAEPRRGYDLLSVTSIGGTINRITEFRGSIIAHYSTASVARWTGSAWSAYSGTYNPPNSSTRVKFFEAESSLFMLTAAGVYELDHPTTGVWRKAGAPAGLQGTATLRRTVSETGFATANGQWAYRVVWGYRNANNRVQLGAPSGRFLLTSPANVVATAANISKPNGSAVVTVASTTHGFVTGEYVNVTLGGAETWFAGAGAAFQVTRLSDTSFTYNDAVTNTSGGTVNPGANITYGFTSRDVTLSIPIPSEITGAAAATAVQYFAQISRSTKSADANSEASDSMGLVYERAPTNLEITTGTMTVTDITPDELRHTELYTSVGRLTDAKYQPPAALDAATFREATFYAGTSNLQALDLYLLAIGGANGLQTPCTIAFNGDPANPNVAPPFAISIVGTTSEDLPNGQFLITTTGSVSQNIAATAKSLVRALNGYTGNAKLYAEYVSTDTEAPGHIRVYARSPVTDEFTALSVGADLVSGSAFSPRIPYEKNISTIGRSGSAVTVTFGSDHGFAVGQQVALNGSNSANFVDGLKTIATVPGSTSFTYTESGTAVGAAANDGAFYSFATDLVTSDAKEIANSIMWSPLGEPGAVPLINFDTVGPSGATIHSLLPTQDHLLVLTDKGAFQVNGNGVNWSITEFDVSLKSKGNRLAAIGSNKGYTFADQGFAELGESARIISRAIDKDLRALLASASSDIASRGFALANDADGLVYFFLPSAASDTSAKQTYVYRPSSREFTRWEWTGGDGSGPVAQDAFISATDGKMYIASGGFVVKERKSLSGVADQMDPIIPGTKSTTMGSPSSNTFVPTDFGTNYWQVGTLVYNLSRGLSSAVTAYTPGAGEGGAQGQLTVASAAGWLGGDTIYPTAGPVGGTSGSTIETVPMMEDDPGAQKVWKVGSHGFRDSRFATATLKFATDLSPTYSAAMTLAPPGGSTAEATAIDWWVPMSWMRGSRIKWKFNHATPQERYALQSWTLRGRLCSPSTSR